MEHDFDNYVDCFCVGTVNLTAENSLNEAVDLYLPQLGDCKIYVFGKEGPREHFHIVNKDKSFQCCVCLTEPKYFKHGRKNDELNRKQREALNTFLKSKKYIKGNRYRTIWEDLVNLWNYSENESYIDLDKHEQPNYTIMTDTIKAVK